MLVSIKTIAWSPIPPHRQIVGLVEHSSGEVRTASAIQVDDRQGSGRPKMTWKTLIENDCHNSRPSRKEHLETRCESCHACS